MVNKDKNTSHQTEMTPCIEVNQPGHFWSESSYLVFCQFEETDVSHQTCSSTNTVEEIIFQSAHNQLFQKEKTLRDRISTYSFRKRGSLLRYSNPRPEFN